MTAAKKPYKIDALTIEGLIYRVDALESKPRAATLDQLEAYDGKQLRELEHLTHAAENQTRILRREIADQATLSAGRFEGQHSRISEIERRLKAVEESEDTLLQQMAKSITDLQRRVKSIEASNCRDTVGPSAAAPSIEVELNEFFRKYGHSPAPAERSAAYPAGHATLVRYLLDKVQEEDWRSVSNAAIDLRELEARCGRR